MTTLDMTKKSARQSNYRKRTRLHHALITLAIWRKAGLGASTIDDVYMESLREYIELDTNKEKINVRKK